MSNENSTTQSLKTDWKTISDIMDNDQTVLVVDNKGYVYQGKITTADPDQSLLMLAAANIKLCGWRML